MKIAVVGAGLGGMTAAARLAANGHEVDLFEASEGPGGKCVRETWKGYTFDTGPSLLTLPATYRDFFLATGSALDLPLEPVDPAFTYVFADHSTLSVPFGPVRSIVSAIDEQWGKGGAQWANLMNRAEQMWDVSRTPFVESELPSVLNFIKQPHLLSNAIKIAPWKSLRDLGLDYLKDPRLQQILDRYATYTGSDPRKAPAVLATIPFVEQNFGAWHISGGVSRIAEAVYQRATEVGVRFSFNTAVERVLLHQDKAAGLVLHSGAKVGADAVVVNADASQLYGSMLPPLPRTRKARARIKKAEPSLAGFVILLGIKGRTGVGHHTVLFPANYDQEFDAVFGRRGYQLPEDPAIYICSPDDPQMRPHDESESWFVLVNVPRHQHGFDWNTIDKESYADKIISLIEQRLQIALRSRIEVSVVRTPLDLEQRVRAPGGAIYGASSNGARSAFLRAANRSPIPGLFLTGGSAHPGGGLPLVAISGELVARAIEEQYG